MKNFKKIIAFILAVAMCFCLSSCSLVDSNDTDITNDNIKIGVVIPAAKEAKEDLVSDVYTNIALEAINSLVEAGYGISAERFRYQENVNPSDADAVKAAVTALINSECNVLFLASPSYAGSITEAANNNPKVHFCIFGGKGNGKNIHTYNANITGASYLTGIVAGLKAKELNKGIGYLVADKSNLSVLNAFAAGALSVNKDVKITATVCTNIKSDCAKFNSDRYGIIASDFYNQTISENIGDLFYCGFTNEDLQNEKFLCSPIYNFTQYYINTIKTIVDFEAPEETPDAIAQIDDYAGNFVSGATGISALGNGVTQDAATAVAFGKSQLESGALSFKIDSAVPNSAIVFLAN